MNSKWELFASSNRIRTLDLLVNSRRPFGYLPCSTVLEHVASGSHGVEYRKRGVGLVRPGRKSRCWPRGVQHREGGIYLVCSGRKQGSRTHCVKRREQHVGVITARGVVDDDEIAGRGQRGGASGVISCN